MPYSLACHEFEPGLTRTRVPIYWYWMPTTYQKARLRELREAAGLTQPGLAELAGVPQQSLSRYENGELHTARVEVVLRIADALGCAVEELFE